MPLELNNIYVQTMRRTNCSKFKQDPWACTECPHALFANYRFDHHCDNHQLDDSYICRSKPRHGYWISNKWTPEGFKYTCDSCGGGNDVPTKYCPHCGLRMYEK